MMKKTKSLFVTSLVLFCLTYGTNTAQAQSLEVVFKSSLWGAAIGSSAFLAAWAIDENPDTDKLGTGIVRGASFGIFAGIVYGFWDVNKGSFSKLEEKSMNSLVHYDRRKHMLIIDPVRNLVRASSPKGKHELTLFSMSF